MTNLRWFASTQIRNFATLAGNIVTGSPISDLNPILVATDAWLSVRSKTKGTRNVSMRSFFLGYRKIDLQADELVLDVNVPLPASPLEVVRAYKQAKRKDDDIAIANACFRVKLAKDFCIEELDVSFGGLAPTTIYLKSLNEKAKGWPWADEISLKLIEELILEAVDLPYSVPGGMPTYRRTLAVSFFRRFWHQVNRDFKLTSKESTFNVEEIEREATRSKQDVGDSIEESKTRAHLSALRQTTGVAKFLDDIPKQMGELHAALVLSSKSHAFIKKVDPSKALALNGVSRYISHTGKYFW